MNKFIAIIFTLAVVICYTAGSSRAEEDKDMKTLTIKWQRLVYGSGQTCQRCGLTGREVQKAFRSLKKSLAPLGIKVTLEEKALDSAACAKDISQSNRIWIGGRPLEEWLSAEVGQSPCQVCCAELGSEVECRTVEVKGKIYEEIPAELIIKAGLVAASKLLIAGPSEPCCEDKTSGKIPSSSCCPEPNSGAKECK